MIREVKTASNEIKREIKKGSNNKEELNND